MKTNQIQKWDEINDFWNHGGKYRNWEFIIMTTAWFHADLPRRVTPEDFARSCDRWTRLVLEVPVGVVRPPPIDVPRILLVLNSQVCVCSQVRLVVDWLNRPVRNMLRAGLLLGLRLSGTFGAKSSSVRGYALFVALGHLRLLWRTVHTENSKCWAELVLNRL